MPRLPQRTPSHIPSPGGAFPPRQGREQCLPQISLSPGPARGSLAKDWQRSAPRAGRPPGVPGSQGARMWLLLLLPESPAGCPGQRWGSVLGTQLPRGSRAGSCPGVPSAGRFICLSSSSSSCCSCSRSCSRAASSRFPVAVSWWPSALPVPIRAWASAGAPLPRDPLCLLPLLRVPELSLCLLWPLGLCSLPAVLLYIPKIM